MSATCLATPWTWKLSWLSRLFRAGASRNPQLPRPVPPPRERSCWDQYRALTPQHREQQNVYRPRGGAADDARLADHPYAPPSFRSNQVPPRSYEPRTPGSYYALLGVPETASSEQIERAYRQYVVCIHPDTHFTDPVRHAEAQEQLKAINAAMQVLRDPVERARYTSRPAGLPLASRMGRADR